jgi:hypothetical protein
VYYLSTTLDPLSFLSSALSSPAHATILCCVISRFAAYPWCHHVENGRVTSRAENVPGASCPRSSQLPHRKLCRKMDHPVQHSGPEAPTDIPIGSVEADTSCRAPTCAVGRAETGRGQIRQRRDQAYARVGLFDLQYSSFRGRSWWRTRTSGSRYECWHQVRSGELADALHSIGLRINTPRTPSEKHST